MSDVNGNTPRAGWYPDPAGSTQQRWWNGTGWTDSLRDAPTAAPAAPVPPVTPAAPVPPVAPVAQTPPAAPPYTPAYGEMHPGAPAPQPPYGAPGYNSAAPAAPAAAPAYNANAAAGYGAHAAPQTNPGASTNTVWIWLIIGLPLLSAFGVFAIDPVALAREAVASSSPYGAGDYGTLGGGTAVVSGLLQLLSFVMAAAIILFGFFDHRALQRIGLRRPFNWRWGFFALLVGPIVYVIGRSVVVKKATGTGLLPLWGFIGVFVLQLIIVMVWVVQVVAAVAEIMPAYMS